MLALLARRAAAAALVLVAASGCDSAAPVATDADLRLDVEARAGGAPFVAGQTFALPDGRAASLTNARLYLSGITLLHADGRETVLAADPITVQARAEDGTEAPHTIAQRYVLAALDAGRAPAALGRVPAGSYRGLRFTIGMRGLDNRINIDDVPDGHPLARQTPSMFWTWNSGYVFALLDGTLDVDGDGTPDPASGAPGSPESGQWRLHVGLTANAETVTVLTPFTIAGGVAQDLRLRVDLARLVDGIDYAVPGNRFCMSMGCQPLVDRFRTNAAAAFELGGVHR